MALADCTEDNRRQCQMTPPTSRLQWRGTHQRRRRIGRRTRPSHWNEHERRRVPMQGTQKCGSRCQRQQPSNSRTVAGKLHGWMSRNTVECAPSCWTLHADACITATILVINVYKISANVWTCKLCVINVVPVALLLYIKIWCMISKQNFTEPEVAVYIIIRN